MTDEQIIKALELCAHWENDKTCEDCPANVFGFGCANKMSKFVLGLINRQTAEIERLKKKNKILIKNADTAFQDGLDENRALFKKEVEPEIRAETIKEFAERLKNYLCLDLREGISVVTIDNIDNLVKEMTEGI